MSTSELFKINMTSSKSLQATLANLFGSVIEPSFAVKYWDGNQQKFGASQGGPAFTLVIKEPAGLLRALRSPSLGFGEAYMNNEIDVEGDLRQIVRLSAFVPKSIPAVKDLLTILILQLTAGGKLSQAKENVTRHYDLGNDFYQSWLDKNMTYSCGYFRQPDYTLDQAQVAKVDYVCKKLDLKKGETLLDVGCGWGHLIFHAVKNYGVKTHGITLSQNQFEYVKNQIQSQGLQKECTVALADYRSVQNQYDKIVGVGMFEHVRKEFIPTYFEKMDQLLKPGGITLLHTIGRIGRGVSDPWLCKYIFPGSYLPCVEEIIWAAGKTSLEISDFENLKFHYGRTLDFWLENFEKNSPAIGQKFGEKFVRMWRLYLGACAGSFYWGNNHLFQFVFNKGWPRRSPKTREGWYNHQL